MSRSDRVYASLMCVAGAGVMTVASLWAPAPARWMALPLAFILPGTTIRGALRLKSLRGMGLIAGAQAFVLSVVVLVAVGLVLFALGIRIDRVSEVLSIDIVVLGASAMMARVPGGALARRPQASVVGRTSTFVLATAAFCAFIVVLNHLLPGPPAPDYSEVYFARLPVVAHLDGRTRVKLDVVVANYSNRVTQYVISGRLARPVAATVRRHGAVRLKMSVSLSPEQCRAPLVLRVRARRSSQLDARLSLRSPCRMRSAR